MYGTSPTWNPVRNHFLPWCMNSQRIMKESNIARRNPFNLYIAIASLPLELEYPLYYIHLKVKLTKKEFACIFGQIWRCWIASSYMWIYDEKILLCNLRKLWRAPKESQNVYTDIVARQFIEQFNSFYLSNVTTTYDKIYFHEHSTDTSRYKEGYKLISYHLDDKIKRDCYEDQLFYYSDPSHGCQCQCPPCLHDPYPNLVIGSSITLYGRIIIHGIPFNISLTYVVISDRDLETVSNCWPMIHGLVEKIC